MQIAFSKTDLSSTFWFTSEKIIHFIFSIIIIPKIFNALGTVDMGKLKFVEASLVMFAPVFFLGLSSICIREMVKHPKQIKNIISTAIIMRLISWGITFIGLVVYFYIVGTNVISTIYFIILLSYLFRLTDVFEWYCITTKKAQFIFYSKTLSLLLVFLLQLYGLKNQLGVIFFSFTIACDYLFQGVFYAVFLKKIQTFKTELWPISFTLAKRLLKFAFPLIISNALVVFYIGIDELFLKYFLNDHAVGVFGSIQFLVIGLSWTIGFAIINALYPALAESYLQQKKTYYLKLAQLNILLLVLGIGIGLFYTFFGNTILNTYFTQQYVEGNTPLKIFCWAPLLVFFGMLYEKHLLSSNSLQHEVYRFAIGCICNIVLCYFLIPVYKINGAAFAVLISHFVTNILYPTFQLSLKPNLKPVLK